MSLRQEALMVDNRDARLLFNVFRFGVPVFVQALLWILHHAEEPRTNLDCFGCATL